MFDTKAEIRISLPSPEGRKTVVIRYFSDNEFFDWRRQKKVVQQDLGRGESELAPVTPGDCDLALFNAIRMDKEDGPPVDEAEALYVLTLLSSAEVSERPEKEGSLYVIRMKVMRKYATSHTLRTPSVRQMMDYERQRSSLRFLKYGAQEIRINYRGAVDLYDSLAQSSEGYAGSVVPVCHKAEAINVLLQEIRAEHEEAPDGDDDEEG